MVTTPIMDKKMERIRSFTSGALKNFGLLFEKSFFSSLVLCMLCTKRFTDNVSMHIRLECKALCDEYDCVCT